MYTESSNDPVAADGQPNDTVTSARNSLSQKGVDGRNFWLETGKRVDDDWVRKHAADTRPENIGWRPRRRKYTRRKTTVIALLDVIHHNNYIARVTSLYSNSTISSTSTGSQRRRRQWYHERKLQRRCVCIFRVVYIYIKSSLTNNTRGHVDVDQKYQIFRILVVWRNVSVGGIRCTRPLWYEIMIMIVVNGVIVFGPIRRPFAVGLVSAHRRI